MEKKWVVSIKLKTKKNEEKRKEWKKWRKGLILWYGIYSRGFLVTLGFLWMGTVTTVIDRIVSS